MSQSIIPAPPGKTSNFENPQDALHTVNLATQILCISVTTVVVTLRFIVRIRIHKTFTLEDYATSMAYAIFMGFCACMLILNHHGGGYHAWDVPMEKYSSFQKASYATTIIYVPMVFTVKLALLSVMLRIFAPDKTKVRVIWISLGLMLIYYVIALFLKVFFCHPISTYWTGSSSGSCMDQQKVIIADSAISIVSDLWILVLPVPMLWSLHMPRVKKLRVIGMLGAGGLATAFSIWRLVIMVEEGKTTDVTFFWIRAVLTANAEGDIGLICACLPTLSSFIANVRNKSSNGSNASYLRSHEMDHWQKISASKKSRRDSFSCPTTQNDQAHLISTAAGVSDAHDDHERSWSTLPTQAKNGNGDGNVTGDQAVIQKDVTVSQSYEFVK